MTNRAALFLSLSILLGSHWVPGAVRAAASGTSPNHQPTGNAAFQSRIKPLLSKYCFGCHGDKKKGDLDLRVYTAEASVLRDRKTFAKVMKNLQAHEMPPEKKPQPTAEERETIWRIYLNKYSVSGELPDDDGWTGAEIKECCRKAYRLKMSLVEAARYIVPVSKSAAEQIKALRQQASGKFISASTPGVYQYEESSPAPRRRAIRDLGGPITFMPPSKSEV